ncbi:uncharacterized protein LOC133324149 [Musca vetustissima]|uniref:uncharacterized protein LOC133324149 n=1 Tax=Musca vetustissima TaxID=27455 RepID=UPI002AB753A8|nr:uncharacterized protein LOC133324149 [Musca vetustissima]
MLDEGVARQLGIHGKPEFLEIQWLNNQSVSEKTEKINLTISGVGEYNNKYPITNVYISSNLSLPIQSCHLAHLIKSREIDQIAEIPFRDYSNVQPKLILSLQHSFLTVPLEAPRMMTDVGPTRLGAVIYGPIPGEKSSNLKRALHVRKRFEEENCDLLQEMHTMMRQYFDVETLGTKGISCSRVRRYTRDVPPNCYRQRRSGQSAISMEKWGSQSTLRNLCNGTDDFWSHLFAHHSPICEKPKCPKVYK